MRDTKEKSIEDALYDFAGAVLSMGEAVGYKALCQSQDAMNEAVRALAAAIRNRQ
jgi:hypothetical protein